ncbi:MAG: FtsH protease activity modulator HflK [candidate division NC10 bacterium]|nr:FtsH protease activity modulator HflK [candidate division NC10 bacterium]
MAAWRPPQERFPDFQEPFELFQRVVRRWGARRLAGLVLGAVFLLWLASGFYVVGPGERGVVLLFGKVWTQTEPGLRYRLPWPVQSHQVVDIARVRRAEVGFRTEQDTTRPVPQEALMLTGDENIVDLHLFIQYLVQDPVRFLFRARDPELALHASAEVALRVAVGENTIDYTMTEGRVEVQDRVKRQLQELLDLYGTGLLVTEARLLVVDPPREVREAFHDVVRAWEDRERLIKEAEGYREDVVPKARGEAAQMVLAAEAYREQRLIRAQGDATRFLKVLDEYRKAEEVTRDRLYLETIDRVLPNTQKFILDAGGDRGGVLPLLPLRDFVPPPAKPEGARVEPPLAEPERR